MFFYVLSEGYKSSFDCWAKMADLLNFQVLAKAAIVMWNVWYLRNHIINSGRLLDLAYMLSHIEKYIIEVDRCIASSFSPHRKIQH